MTLSIVDARDGAALVHCWLGGNRLVERISEIMGPATFTASTPGYESWAITSKQLDGLTSAFYANAPSAAEVARYEASYGTAAYVWFLEHDF